MDRRKLAEENYRKKFDEFGLSERFEFLRREWSKDHDKRFWCRCRSCGNEFLSWNEVFKRRQKHLICPCCGSASDGNDMFTRTDTARQAAELYEKGLTQTVIAEKLGCSVWDVGNAVKAHKVVDPQRRSRGGLTANRNKIMRHAPIVKDYLSRRGLELIGEWKGESAIYRIRNVETGEVFERRGRGLKPRLNRGCFYRARKKNAMVDNNITIDALIERDGCNCYICGEKTNFNDLRWGNFGPDYPTIDHVVPLAHGGVHSWDNVRVCCGLCNVTKRDQLLEGVI